MLAAIELRLYFARFVVLLFAPHKFCFVQHFSRLARVQDEEGHDGTFAPAPDLDEGPAAHRRRGPLGLHRALLRRPQLRVPVSQGNELLLCYVVMLWLQAVANTLKGLLLVCMCRAIFEILSNIVKFIRLMLDSESM